VSVNVWTDSREGDLLDRLIRVVSAQCNSSPLLCEPTLTYVLCMMCVHRVNHF
jgi:hypothetical protein